ncbi:MAG: hypothetical protein F6K50_31615 [Moorea sp. SIO3I7]|nr:hypothetical protein [Moorena sp. SIO3I8]NEN99860.1 hypothetical protein [Moorena sp. SIO3I7]NEO06652.1 hypothetical protein [Moorena sp. SIO3I8]NEQ83183.1 hypothetical protein [Moorena sp. SIO2I5]
MSTTEHYDNLALAKLNQFRECLFPVPYSLLPVPCSLFPVPCSLCYC